MSVFGDFGDVFDPFNLLGGGKKPKESPQLDLGDKAAIEAVNELRPVLVELVKQTRDDDVYVALKRAVGLYRACVQAAAEGGELQVLDAEGNKRRYKVPLKDS